MRDLCAKESFYASGCLTKRRAYVRGVGLSFRGKRVEISNTNAGEDGVKKDRDGKPEIYTTQRPSASPG